MRLLIKRKKKEKKRMVSETLAVIVILGDINSIRQGDVREINEFSSIRERERE